MTDKTTHSVKSVWDCSHTMQTQMLMEANQIGIDIKASVDQHRKETNLIQGTHVVAQKLLGGVVKNGSEPRKLASDTARISHQPSDATERSDG